MGETQRRCDRLRYFGERAQVRTALAIRSHCPRGFRVALVVLVMTAAQTEGPLSGRVRAQDSPARKDTAATTGAPAEGAASEPASAPATAEALSLRYRFIEKYGVTEDPNHPELITQYQVGIVETQKQETEKAQGAPDREEISQNTIYTERVAQASKLGEMLSVVRRYDKFAMRDVSPVPPSKPPLFRGLEILIRRQASQKPKVLSLTTDHPLREREFSEMTKQVLVPQLTALLPPVPKRVGDSWAISRPAAYCLVSEIPDENDFELKGTLTEVKKAASGAGLVAVIDIAGQMNLALGLSSLRAQLHFVFDPPPAITAAAVSAKGADDDATKPRERHREVGVVDARGRLTRVRMLWAVSDVLPDSDGRLKQTTTYDLTLERRFTLPPRDAAGAPNAVLAVPEPLPTPDESNSWVIYEDPLQRYYFRHPQELLLQEPQDPAAALFAEKSPKGHVLITVSLQPKDGKRQRLDPEFHRRDLFTTWEKQKKDVLKGSIGWLPEAEWTPLQRKVYRIEVALIPKGDTPGNADRNYLDYYLVLFNANESAVVMAMTEQESNIKLRTDAEGIIKSFTLGKWNGQLEAPAAAPPAAKLTAPK